MKLDHPLKWKCVRAKLDPVLGSEQAGERPVLIISSEEINQKLTTVAVLPLTSARQGRQVYSSEALLPAGIAGQPNASIVMAQQIRVISVDRITSEYGRLDDETTRERVRQAMCVYLDLLEDARFDEDNTSEEAIPAE